jgi:hypothetical protein
MEEVEERVEPAPESGAGPGAHEAGDHRLPGIKRLAQKLGVENGLEPDGHRRDPKEERGRTSRRPRGPMSYSPLPIDIPRMMTPGPMTPRRPTPRAAGGRGSSARLQGSSPERASSGLEPITGAAEPSGFVAPHRGIDAPWRGRIPHVSASLRSELGRLDERRPCDPVRPGPSSIPHRRSGYRRRRPGECSPAFMTRSGKRRRSSSSRPWN